MADDKNTPPSGGAVVSKAPVTVAGPDSSIKRGGIYNYVLKDGGRNANGEKCDLDTVAMVIGVTQKSRVKLDGNGGITYQDKEINTTKGKQTVKQPVYETYLVYSINIYCDAWADYKFVPGVEASALTLI